MEAIGMFVTKPNLLHKGKRLWKEDFLDNDESFEKYAGKKSTFHDSIFINIKQNTCLVIML